jgi:hypothetical protein
MLPQKEPAAATAQRHTTPSNSCITAATRVSRVCVHQQAEAKSAMGPAFLALLALCQSTSAAPTVAAEDGAAAAAAMKPLLFMEERDLVDKFGKLKMVANEVQRMPELSAPPGLNYTGGDTVTAAFPLLDGPGAEIFVAVGRPGEPYMFGGREGSGCLCSNTCPQACNPDQGVKLQRFTTTDFKTWSEPVTVAYFPNGSGEEDEDKDEEGEQTDDSSSRDRTMDGTIWTLKSMDRSPAGQYLLAGSYGSSVHFFMSDTPPTKEKSETNKTPPRFPPVSHAKNRPFTKPGSGQAQGKLTTAHFRSLNFHTRLLPAQFRTQPEEIQLQGPR